MSKTEIDREAAERFREVSYERQWHLKGLRLLHNLGKDRFSLLDTGCGNCEFAEMVSGEFNAEITCKDYVDHYLRRAERLGFTAVKCDFDSSEDIERVRSNFGKSFDVITSFEVIEHIFDVDTFLSTIHNMLKDNGILILSRQTMPISHTGYIPSSVAISPFQMDTMSVSSISAGCIRHCC
jgi:2-polyprenyl-3-methyl-5-hydroxy-6-metoxy-1,4-benzoquinol methylase